MRKNIFIKVVLVGTIILSIGFIYRDIKNNYKTLKMDFCDLQIPLAFEEQMTEDDFEYLESVISDNENIEPFLEYLYKIDKDYNLMHFEKDITLADKLLSDLYLNGKDQIGYVAQTAFYLAFRTQLRRYFKYDLYAEYDFPELNNTGYVSIFHSDDKRFRLISYDDFLGGTMRSYDSFIHFRNKSGEIMMEPYKNLVSNMDVLNGDYETSDPVKGVFFTSSQKLKSKENCYLIYSMVRLSSYWTIDNMDIFTFSDDKITYRKDLYPSDIVERYESPSGLSFSLEFCNDKTYDENLIYGVTYDSVQQHFLVQQPDLLPFYFKLEL